VGVEKVTSIEGTGSDLRACRRIVSTVGNSDGTSEYKENYFELLLDE
jgi:hypothetical protein